MAGYSAGKKISSRLNAINSNCEVCGMQVFWSSYLREMMPLLGEFPFPWTTMMPIERSRNPFSGLDTEIKKQLEQLPQSSYLNLFGSSL